MKKSLVLALGLALGVTASAYAANPFSDVPAGHWAYDSIDKLAAAGIIDGMGDGTFQGDRNMTRYEMAQIVAKAMAKGANVEKLAAEFADELDALGVRVANLEKKSDNVKISGRMLARLWNFKASAKSKDYGYGGSHRYVLRSDLFVNGQVNEDWSYTARIRNEQSLHGAYQGAGETSGKDLNFKEAYVQGRIGGVKVLAGRYNDYLEDGDIYDDFGDQVMVEYGKDLKLTAAIGQYDASMGPDHDTKFAYARLDGKLGKLGAHAAYYRFNNFSGVLEDSKIFAAGINAPLGKNFNLAGTYFHTNADADGLFNKDGFAVNLDYKGASNAKPGSYGLWAKYYNLPAGVVIAHTMDGLYPADGFKGWKVGGDYTLAKNIMLRVEYYGLEGKEISKHYDTLYSHVMFSF